MTKSQKASSPPPTDLNLYARQMELLRERLDTIVWLFHTGLVLKTEPFFVTELIFVQFRKVLELLAFASLVANKDEYSAVHAKFKDHWKAWRMVEELKKVNPHYFPKPIRLATPPEEAQKSNRWHYEVLKTGYLTEDEFIQLYDSAADVLHTRNPFSEKDPVIHVKYEIPDWVGRIRSLLQTHTMLLVNGNALLVHVPNKGTISVQHAAANPNVR